jgi:hypothetical protein
VIELEHTMYNPITAGRRADKLIAGEVQLQDAIWGVANDRANVRGGEMLLAATAQLTLVRAKAVVRPELWPEVERQCLRNIYPKDWTGFRDYGSDIANLVVAGAYIRQEIKRKLMLGEDATRSSRPKDKPYTGTDQPAFTTADPGWQDKVVRLADEQQAE